MHIKNTLKSKYKQLVPLFHFILTFIWDRRFFVYIDNWDCWYTDVRNSGVISDINETRLVYLLSRIFAFFIICLIWKIVFFVMDGNVLREDLVLLSAVFCIGLICIAFIFPNIPEIGLDNYTNYLMARRFLPTYWHSIYTGALYGGCLMIIPHPFGIHIFQWLFLFCSTGYIYLKIREFYGDTMIRYVPLLLLLLPESYYLAFIPYRNNYFTILVMLYISYLFFRVKRKDPVVTKKEILCFAGVSSFIMVWRSEGILYGLGGMIIYTAFILNNGKIVFKRMLYTLSGFVILFIALNRIQAIGSEKYYGRDYMMINTTNVLRSIFNDPEANLTYRNAEYDVEHIDAVVPVEALREYGMEGFRKNNWTNGRADFNQTLASDDMADAYMKAYYRIILHNLDDYLDVQINNLYESLQLPATHKVYIYDGDPMISLEDYEYRIWEEGAEEVKGSYGTGRWEKSKIRMVLGIIINEIISIWRGLIINSGMNRIFHALTLLGACVTSVFEFLKWIREKGKEHLALSFSFMVILGECAAVLLFMPEGRPSYMYPVLYAGYTLFILYWLEKSGTWKAATGR